MGSNDYIAPPADWFQTPECLNLTPVEPSAKFSFTDFNSQ